jgi:hypothetical protein
MAHRRRYVGSETDIRCNRHVCIIKKTKGQICRTRQSSRPHTLFCCHCVGRRCQRGLANPRNILHDSFVSFSHKVRQSRINTRNTLLDSIDAKFLYVSPPLGLQKMRKFSGSVACLLLSQARTMLTSDGVKGQGSEWSREGSRSTKDHRSHWQRYGGAAFLRKAGRV